MYWMNYVYWPLVYSTRNYTTVYWHTQTNVLSALQSPLAVSWQRLLPREILQLSWPRRFQLVNSPQLNYRIIVNTVQCGSIYRYLLPLRVLVSWPSSEGIRLTCSGTAITEFITNFIIVVPGHRYRCPFILCLGSGLATGWSSVQGAQPTVYRIKELKKRPRSTGM
jgi:hypothetical protein